VTRVLLPHHCSIATAVLVGTTDMPEKLCKIATCI
jgi:hypothetical protein